jgi:hypothetical protein
MKYRIEYVMLWLLCLMVIVVMLGVHGIQRADARIEEFVDTNNNNLTVSIQAPDSWNSGMASATLHALDWRGYGLATLNDNRTAYFVIVNLPPVANSVVPLGVISGTTTTFLSKYVTIDNQYDVKFSDGSSGHAYSISITPEQLSKLQLLLPSINNPLDAVLIITQHQGGTYIIAYATQLGRMDNFIGTFQNILNSVKFGSATFAGPL